MLYKVTIIQWFTYRVTYVATVAMISIGDTNPIVATSNASKFDEIHNGRNKLNPKTLDK